MAKTPKELSEMILSALKKGHLNYYTITTKVLPKGTLLADITRAFGLLWEAGKIDQDNTGNYCLKSEVK